MTDDSSEKPSGGGQYVPDPPAAEEKYTRELLSVTRSLNDVLLSYKNDVRREKAGLGTQVERLLLNMLETYDGVSAYIRQYEGKNVEGFEWVQAICLDLRQKLERAGVTPMNTEKGDPYDEIRHEIVNLVARPPDFHGRPAIRSVAVPGYFLKSKVLRRARVEVDWVPEEKAK
jgi:molecular chaperone GrpE (heat shock protein)